MTTTAGAARRDDADLERQNAKVVRRYLDTFVTRDLDTLAEVLADDVEVFGATQHVRGRDVVARAITTPGLSCVGVRVVELFAAADRVTVLVELTWRQDRTGTEVVQSACKMYQLREGRIVKFWGESDTYGLARGLGLLPAPLDFR